MIRSNLKSFPSVTAILQNLSTTLPYLIFWEIWIVVNLYWPFWWFLDLETTYYYWLSYLCRLCSRLESSGEKLLYLIPSFLCFHWTEIKIFSTICTILLFFCLFQLSLTSLSMESWLLMRLFIHLIFTHSIFWCLKFFLPCHCSFR